MHYYNERNRKIEDHLRLDLELDPARAALPV